MEIDFEEYSCLLEHYLHVYNNFARYVIGASEIIDENTYNNLVKYMITAFFKLQIKPSDVYCCLGDLSVIKNEDYKEDEHVFYGSVNGYCLVCVL